MERVFNHQTIDEFLLDITETAEYKRIVIRTLVDKKFSYNRVSELIGTGDPYIYGETYIYPVAHPGYWGTRTRGKDNVIAVWMRIRK